MNDKLNSNPLSPPEPLHSFVVNPKPKMKNKIIAIAILAVIVGLVSWLALSEQYKKNNTLLNQSANNLTNPINLQTKSAINNAPEISFNLTSGKLATISGNFKIDQFTISPDGFRVAYVAEDNYQSFVVVNGKEDKHYSAVEKTVEKLFFSPDGKLLFYKASDDTKSPGETYVVINSVESKPYSRVEGLQTSKDGKNYAYVAWPVGGVGSPYVVLNGKEQTPHMAIDENSLVFSPDGRRLAYKAVDYAGGPWLMVVDDKEQKTYKNVSNLVFSPDSQTFAYVGEQDGKYYLVVNAQQWQSYETAVNSGIYGKPGELAFSPGGKQVAYVANNNDKFAVIVNDKPGKWYKSVSQPKFSADGQTLIYGADDDKGAFLVTNGKEGQVLKGYTSVQFLGFTTDGNLLSVVMQYDESLLKKLQQGSGDVSGVDKASSFIQKSDLLLDNKIISDGWQIEPYPIYLSNSYHVSNPSDYSSLILKGTQDNKWTLFVNAKAVGHSYDDDTEMLDSTNVAYNSGSFAFALNKYEKIGVGDTTNKKSLIVFNGNEYPAYDTVGSLTVSKDGKNVAYIAQQGKKFFVVLNDKTGTQYDNVWALNFSPDNSKIVYGARSGNNLLWVVEDVGKFTTVTAAPVDDTANNKESEQRDWDRLNEVNSIFRAISDWGDANRLSNGSVGAPEGDHVVLNGKSLCSPGGWKDKCASGEKILLVTKPAPTPPDGTCTAEQNSYTYTKIKGSILYGDYNFQVTFCVGQRIDGLRTWGVNYAAPGGIK